MLLRPRRCARCYRVHHNTGAKSPGPSVSVAIEVPKAPRLSRSIGSAVADYSFYCPSSSFAFDAQFIVHSAVWRRMILKHRASMRLHTCRRCQSLWWECPVASAEACHLQRNCGKASLAARVNGLLLHEKGSISAAFIIPRGSTPIV